jgi:tRNA-specific 2-thiouridylase
VRVLVAMSGGVDSSVAAALALEEGHEVVGVTMKLWGGEADRGCCAVSDVEDARRVADQLGIAHHVFNFSEDFERDVVAPYVAAHRAGRTPNPCVDCNLHLKFDRLLRRAVRLGFDALATGHYARIAPRPDGTVALLRGVDRAKDQSYVLSVLGQEQLARLMFPLGCLEKAAVRTIAERLRLRTASKPDSQDVCFVTRAEGRRGFLGRRIPLTPARLVDAETGAEVGSVPAAELVTVGQRRGLGCGGFGEPRYALAVDPARGTVLVGSEAALSTRAIPVGSLRFVGERPGPEEVLLVQASAHGEPTEGRLVADGDRGVVELAAPRRRVAPGQVVAFYRGDEVLGSGVAA